MIFSKIKKVRFTESNKIHLIPFENEYIFHIWYSENELLYFKKTAVKEILELIKRHDSMTYKDAIKLLYQPNNISYDMNNFE